MVNQKVSIIIPNWNGAEKIKKNLPRVLEIEGIFEIIIVDDGSTDESVTIIENDFPKVKLIKKPKNSGFSSTVNLGVKESTGDLVFLLNTDAVPKKDCLKNILSHFENSKVFSVGFNTGGNWSWAKFSKGFFWHYMIPLDQDRVTHETLWVSGGSGVFRKSIWEKIGGFDEIYDPFYEEDVDLGYRAIKRGFINIWEKDAEVEHYHQGVTSGNKEKGVIEENFSKGKISSIAQRNQLFFIWKNITDWDLIIKHIFYLKLKIILNPKYFLVYLRALVKLSEILEKRSKEKKESILSDREILSKY